ncbi:phage portal protein [Caproiciproducens sp.]
MNIDFNNPLWFKNEINTMEQRKHIDDSVNIDNYLLGRHKILGRPDIKWKGEQYTTAKIVFDLLKAFVTFHTGYLVKNPVSVTCQNDQLTKLINKVYRKGLYPAMDYEVASDLYSYGNAFEYVYLDKSDNIIKSKRILNNSAYPLYDEFHNYYAFVDHWVDNEFSHTYDIVYLPDTVKTFQDDIMIDEKINLTGLPIHYAMLNKTEYQFFGDSFIRGLINIVDRIEAQISKTDDAVTKLSLNPLGVMCGTPIAPDDTIKDTQSMVGTFMNIGFTDKFEWATAQVDKETVEFEIKTLLQQLYAIGGIPASMVGQSNVSNVSEVSLGYLYNQTDDVAGSTIQALKAGFYKRWEYIRKLLELQGNKISDDDFDTMDCSFALNKTVNTTDLIDGLKTMRDMGAISRKTLMEKSPYITDSSLEMERIKAEQAEELALQNTVNNNSQDNSNSDYNTESNNVDNKNNTVSNNKNVTE